MEIRGNESPPWVGELLGDVETPFPNASTTMRWKAVVSTKLVAYWADASDLPVNQVGTNLKIDLEPRGIAVALLHPGLVATDMTGGQGIDPVVSAEGLIQRIDELSLENSGGFWHAEGYELPW